MIFNCEACGSSNVQRIGSELICSECGHTNVVVDRRASLLDPDTPAEQEEIQKLYTQIHEIIKDQRPSFRVGFKSVVEMLRGCLIAWGNMKLEEAEQLPKKEQQKFLDNVILSQHIQTIMLIINQIPIKITKLVIKALQDSIEYSEKQHQKRKKMS